MPESGCIELDKWHHILASYDGLYAKIIVTKVNGLNDFEILKGEEKYLGSNLKMCYENSPLWIGARYSDGYPQYFFIGEMDDLQIYKDVAR